MGYGVKSVMQKPKEFKICEYGRIHQIQNGQPKQENSLSDIYLPKPAWDELAVYANSSDKAHRFLRVKTTTVLKVVNFVGVITTGKYQIEILPKIDDGKNLDASRDLLWGMLRKVYKLPMLESTKAQLRLKNQPLPEALITCFLSFVGEIIRRGIRKDYTRIGVQEQFLKGQLQLTKQIRQGAHRAHIFNMEYDIFSDNRAENRLIHAALLQALRWSRNFNNQKLARQYQAHFEQVPVSRDYQTDFDRWRVARDMVHYQSVLPWLKLILNQQSPHTIKGKQDGISFLFPMEKLFEKYVARCLDEQLQELQSGYSLIEQSSKYHLATASDGNKIFQMKPDFLIRKGNDDLLVLDCKWKQIDQNKTYNDTEENHNLDPKMGISQADMYQLFAYGKKYGVSKVVLIYPKWSGFKDVFEFDFESQLDEGLSLLVVPFCLQENILSKALDELISETDA